MALFGWASTAAAQWRPRVGDPSLIGWVTTLLYIAAGGLALRASRRSVRASAMPDGAAGLPAVDHARLGRFWLAMACGLLALGLNKQLDLQTLFTEWAKELAHAQGWYAQRRGYQLAFVATLFLAVGLGAAWLLRVFWHLRRHIRVALLGVGLVALYVLLRAAIFQRIGLHRGSAAVGLVWLLEVGGIGLVLDSARRVSGPKRMEKRR